MLNELLTKIKPICDTEDELKAIPLYLDTDSKRKKIIDFINIADSKGHDITADQLMLLVILVSNESE